jgi:hypothetical protein
LRDASRSLDKVETITQWLQIPFDSKYPFRSQEPVHLGHDGLQVSGVMGKAE